ncbi:hypothetical protein [Kribbella endophytica]
MSNAPRWRTLPRWTRWTLAVYLIGFVEGACAHVLDLARGGIHVYASFAPLPLQVLFVCLVVLDPLVVVLVALVRPWGVRLACAVMALDVTANWITNWPQLQDDPTSLIRPYGLLPITLFGVFVLGSALPVLRVLRSSRSLSDAGRGSRNQSTARGAGTA